MGVLLTGISISKGVAIGKSYIMKQGQNDTPEYHIEDYLIDSEVERYTMAIKTARIQLQEISEIVTKEASSDISDFIESHILTLDESAISRKPCSIIRKEKINAEWALKKQHDTLVKVFDDVNDPYLQSRKDDIIQVVDIISNILKNQGIEPIVTNDEKSESARIIISDHLSPTDLALLKNKNIAGFVSEFDAPSSHTAIMARTLNIPAITGIKNVHQLIEDGEPILIDGKYGCINVNPDEKSLAHYNNLTKVITQYKEDLKQLADKPAVTIDNEIIKLQLNLDSNSDLIKVNKLGADDIGLYRTESLYINHTEIPNEEEQFEYYVKLCKSMPGKTITIRTLDLSNDYKTIPGIKRNEHSNPMLGLRAIRFSLAHPNIFKIQLTSILRASAFGNIRILLPLVVCQQEIAQVKEVIQQIQQELTEKEIPFDENLKIGVMVETPAAALSVPTICQNVDFISLGTNDLIQYMLAIDRNDEKVNYLFDHAHPAVLNIISQAIKQAYEAETEIYICGDMASNPKYIRLLLGMGLRNLSVIPSQILEIKNIIRGTNIENSKLFVNEILKSHRKERIHELIDKLNT